MREGFGLTVLEAMALGVVPLLVQAPLNAAVELVGDGGVVVGAEAGEYAEALEELVVNESVTSEIAAESKRRTKVYDLKRVVRRLEGYYETVVRD